MQMGQRIHCPLYDRGVVSVAGDDAREFLQGLITNDIQKVTEDSAIYAALLTPQGRFLFDFFIVEHQECFLLDCEIARIPELIKKLTMYRLRAKVEILDMSERFSVGILLDTNGSDIFAGEVGGPLDFDGVCYTDPRHAGLGERTIHLINEDASFPADKFLVSNCRAEYDSRRIMLGIPDSINDLIPEKSFPLETGFDELNGVDFQKGCYVGQEVTIRMKHRNLVKKRLFPVEFDGDLAQGAIVKSGDIAAGQIHSTQRGHGLALLRLDLVGKGGLTSNGVSINAQKPNWMRF
tara:strand:- start:1072 stop:1950 length:879 start_codon:yes stop_codon:yes gene_type:complete